MAIEKKIAGIFRGSGFNMVGDGFKVTNYFPNGNKFGKKISPFFLLDYNPPLEFRPSETPKGVGVHPHRGFETVTIVFEGAIAHRDSSGNSGIIRAGDVQWMTAASGILHKEFLDDEFLKRGGVSHMLQLWVNLPAKDKMSKPRYQALTSDKMGRVHLSEGNGEVIIVAGDYNGTKGPASTFTPINLHLVNLRQHGRFNASFSSTTNTGLLVTKGRVLVNTDHEARNTEFVLFENEGEEIEISAPEPASFVLMNGEPINERVVQYGPFLMNTPEQIKEAIYDYNNGKFGELAE